MTEQTIQKSIFLKATAEQVWAFLTDPDKIEQWFHRPQAALVAGEVYEMIGKDSGEVFMSGKVLIANPHTQLEYEFNLIPMGNTRSHVAWRLDEFDGGTKLSLTHSGLPQSAIESGLFFGLDKGWDEHLGKLREGLTED